MFLPRASLMKPASPQVAPHEFFTCHDNDRKPRGGGGALKPRRKPSHHVGGKQGSKPTGLRWGGSPNYDDDLGMISGRGIGLTFQ